MLVLYMNALVPLTNKKYDSTTVAQEVLLTSETKS